MLGACALLWNHEAAEQLVKWADEKGWRGDVTRVIDDPVDKKAGDTFVGEVLTFLGWEIWMHLPSLVGHIGINSTLGHQSQGVDDNREAADFPGERTDAREVCGWWPYIKRGTATNGSRRRSPVSTTTLTRS
jgi:hypothetical protein